MKKNILNFVNLCELLRLFKTLSLIRTCYPHTALLRRLYGVIGISCRWHERPRNGRASLLSPILNS